MHQNTMSLYEKLHLEAYAELTCYDPIWRQATPTLDPIENTLHTSTTALYLHTTDMSVPGSVLLPGRIH